MQYCKKNQQPNRNSETVRGVKSIRRASRTSNEKHRLVKNLLPHAVLHSLQFCFSFPWGQGLHSTHMRFRFPWGQGVHSAQLYLSLPWGQGLHSTQLVFRLPWGQHGGRGCTPRSCVSTCRGGRRCTPHGCTSPCRADTGCSLRSCSSASRADTGCTPRSCFSSCREGIAFVPLLAVSCLCSISPTITSLVTRASRCSVEAGVSWF